MRAIIHPSGVNLWLSARDTYDWAHRSGSSWPCSQLSDRRVFAAFDTNGLCDLSIDGGKGEQDIDATEFNAIVSDHLAKRLPKDHPSWFVVVGQFQDTPSL